MLPDAGLVLKVTEYREGRDVSPEFWQTPPSLGHQQGRWEQDGDTTPFKVSVPMVQRWADGFASLKRTVDLRKACLGRYFLASSPTPCTFQQEGELPVTSCHRLGRFAGPYPKLLLPQYPYTEKKKPKKALQEISENKCWWSAFLKQSQWFHIINLSGCNPDWSSGIPSAFYGKQRTMRLHCLQQKYSQLFYPESFSRNGSTFGFLSRNRAGWSQGDTGQVYVYIYLHNICATTQKGFSTSYGFTENLLKELSPWLSPWPGNAATSGLPDLPNLLWSTVLTLSWPCAASGYEEDLMSARTWQNFCTNFKLNLYLARQHMPEGNILVKKKSEWLRLGGTCKTLSFQAPCHW